MIKIKHQSNFENVDMISKIIGKEINLCAFFNGSITGVTPMSDECYLGYKGDQFVIGYWHVGLKAVDGEYICFRTEKGGGKSYDINTVDEKIVSYKSFSVENRLGCSFLGDIYPHASMTSINTLSRKLNKCTLYGYSAKRVIAEFPEDPDSEKYDLDLHFVHSVVFYLEGDLVMVLDIDNLDSKTNYMNLHLLSNQNFENKFLNEQFKIKDDWGYLRYEELFTFGK